MSKFSPGPWKAVPHQQVREQMIGAHVMDVRGRQVAGFGIVQPQVVEEVAANARLIAAAPELYLMVLRLAELNEAADVSTRERSVALGDLGRAARSLLNQLDLEGEDA